MLPEDVLCAVVDRRGRSPRAWAAEPLMPSERVLEVGREGSLTVDLRAPGHTPVRQRLRGAAPGLPLRTNGVDGLCLMLVLSGTADLDGLFTEVRRVLRPAGTLVVITPSASPRRPAELALRAVHRTGWAHRSALDAVGWLLAAADFAVLSDERVPFSVPVPDETTARALARDLPDAGLWPPDPAPDAGPALARVAGPGGRWPLPLRRVVARR